MQIHMSAGSLRKWYRFIVLLALVILPSLQKLAADCMRNGKKLHKIPNSAMVKWSRIHMQIWINIKN